MNMKEIIEAKITEYKSLRSDDPELRKWLRDSDLWYWLYSVLRLTGRPLSKHQILSILKGELNENLPLNAYEFLHNCAAVYRDMESSIDMQMDPDMKLLSRWYTMVFGDECVIRKTNPVVYQWNFVPPHFNQVPALLDGLFKKYARHRTGEDVIDRSMSIMLEFLRLYPFGEDSVVMAALLVMYELLEAGIPVPSLTVGEQEFNSLVGSYLSGGNRVPVTEMFERSLLNRLEAVLLVLRQAGELND